MTYYYSILFFSFIIPFLFSFHPKVNFYKKFHTVFLSIFITSIPFIVWDIIFVKNGIWGFNKNYISGIYIFNLPIEELLFFFIIPFCCMYTYHLIEKFNISFFKINNWKKINLYLAFSLLVFASFFFNKQYTFFCLTLCSLLIFYGYFSDKINYNSFYTLFIIIMIPFVLVNGALTGLFLNQYVVWYNQNEILNIYLFTIPIEDIFYSFQLILLNIMIYKKISPKIPKIS